ncbi:hypothetical protein ACFYQQ_01140 [Streptomyces sp. NPDC005496]|uniref:hypothetical protein n=1 Tax=unclassified Streptomyces TaxID=2593676 RepID=UPI0033B7773B
MPKCAWILIAALALILHHAIGIAATIAFAFDVLAWIAATPAALIAVAALAAWHLLNAHAPHTRRRAPATARA